MSTFTPERLREQKCPARGRRSAATRMTSKGDPLHGSRGGRRWFSNRRRVGRPNSFRGRTVAPRQGVAKHTAAPRAKSPRAHESVMLGPDDRDRPKKRPVSEIALNQFDAPEHANALGNVHGGVIMKMEDEACAIVAMRHAQNPCSRSRSTDDLQTAGHVGQLMVCQARVTYVGRSRRRCRCSCTRRPATPK